MTELIDISENNFPVDYAKLKDSGVKGLWIKVADGTIRNEHFKKEELHKARMAGLHVGPYYFCEFRHERPIHKEIGENFLAPLKEAGYGKVGHDLRPMLDLETTHVGPAKTLDMLEEAVLEMMHAFNGRHPMIYTGSFWRDTLGNPSRQTMLRKHPNTAKCMLIQSFYGKNDGEFHPITSTFVIKGWNKVTVQQYSGDVVGAPGVKGMVDKDRLLGDKDIEDILI